MERYEELEMEVVEFEAEDVITDSSGDPVTPEVSIDGTTG